MRRSRKWRNRKIEAKSCGVRLGRKRAKRQRNARCVCVSVGGNHLDLQLGCVGLKRNLFKLPLVKNHRKVHGKRSKSKNPFRSFARSFARLHTASLQWIVEACCVLHPLPLSELLISFNVSQFKSWKWDIHTKLDWAARVRKRSPKFEANKTKNNKCMFLQIKMMRMGESAHERRTESGREVEMGHCALKCKQKQNRYEGNNDTKRKFQRPMRPTTRTEKIWRKKQQQALN